MPTSSSDSHPDLSRLNGIDLIARANCVYLRKSTTGVPLDPIRLWPVMILLLDDVNSDEQQKSAELYTCNESQASEIQVLQNDIAQLKLASTPATVPYYKMI